MTTIDAPTYSELYCEDFESSPAWDTSVRDYVWKLDGRRMAESLDVPVPALLDGPAPLAELSPPDRSAVLKPTYGFSGKGVSPLTPLGDGLYRSLFTQKTGTWHEFTADAWKRRAALRSNDRAIARRSLHDLTWFIEEIAGGGDELPDDVKCYVFGGRVELIRQRKSGHGPNGIQGSTYAYWSRSWDWLDNVDTERSSEDLPVPTNRRAIVDGAEVIGRFLGVPFVRVDMYPSGVFGEITPKPGRDSFTPEWDHRLGNAWLNAIYPG